MKFLIGWGVGFALSLQYPAPCRAQSVLTPAQALSYRRVTDLTLSPDGSQLAYVMYSYRWDWRPHLWLLDVPSGTARAAMVCGWPYARISVRSRRQDAGVHHARGRW